MQLRSENPNLPYFSKSIIKQLQAQLKPEILDTEDYQNLLADLILKGKGQIIDCPEITLDSISNGKPNDLITETLLGHLYDLLKSLKKTTQTINKCSSVVEILAWGYYLRLKNKKSVVINCDMGKFDIGTLKALWAAIKLSELESIEGLKRFGSQTHDAWVISCRNIVDSHLTSFHFSGQNFLSDLSLLNWKLFWDSIQLSNIQHLDMTFVSLTLEQLSSGFWDTLCNGIKRSKIKSISFERMSLNKLNYAQWRELYDALYSAEIQSINLTCNHLWSSNFEIEEQLRIHSLIIKIISIPSLKHLIWLEDTFESMDSELMSSFCKQLENSQLEHLEICLSMMNPLPENAWLSFIDSLKKMQLKTLVIQHALASELSSLVINSLSDMISESSLESFSCIHNFGSLSLPLENWQALGSAFKKKSIKAFNFGLISLDRTHNMDGFSKFILNTDIDSLNLNNQNSYCMSLESWNKISESIKKSRISTMDITRNNLVSFEVNIWEIFCDMIENSSIKTLHFDTSYFNRLPYNHLKLFCKAIRQGNLETLILSTDYTFWEMKTENLKMIFDAINRSKINNLVINKSKMYNLVLDDTIYFLSPSLKEMVLNTLRIVENKATYKNTLFGRCIHTLFGQCNAEVTDAGLSYDCDGKQLEDRLSLEFKEGLKKFI